MISIIRSESLDAPEISFDEIKRYFGASDDCEYSDKIINECLYECKSILKYNICRLETDINVSDKEVDFGFTVIKSGHLAKSLAKCNKAVIFAATIGLGIDRLIAKYSRISPSKAMCFQAIGAERIEALCDFFSENLKKEYGNGFIIHNRFSPGYGDFSLEYQCDILNVLDSSKRIGLTLTDSMLMMPSKSVTAIIGIEAK